jgi:hypothetical protein
VFPKRRADPDSTRAGPFPVEGETERAVKRIVPWVVSAGLHAGMVGLGLIATWTVVSLTDEQEPAVVIAQFDALSYDPLVTLETQPPPVDQEPTPQPDPSRAFEQALARQLADLEVPPIGLALDPGAAASPPIEFAPPPGSDTATFVGITTSNARRIVYVIDASGSMIRSLQIVIEELARSLATLSPQQSFAVIFFQRNEALMVPPANRLTAATPEAQLRALGWIDDRVIPAGRSNPLAAIEKALSLRPDVIFLLSENITGSGEFEIDQEDLLDLLDQLNPADAKTGRRPAQINCVQFLDPDPLDTLRKIAERHGGPDGYRFLDRAELGLTAP